MAKLVEIAARHVREWPKDAVKVYQRRDGQMYAMDTENWAWEICVADRADDYLNEVVTRAQWEAERARIAANQQATAEAREIAKGLGTMLNETPGGLTDEEFKQVGGKRSAEDQELWDKVLLQQLDKMAKPESLYQGEFADCVAIAFERTEYIMAERANRMKD